MKEFILCIIFTLTSFLCFSQEYHVSKTGNDSSPGTDAEPWGTIQHALENATSGSTVFIHEGQYNESLYALNSGGDTYTLYKSFENDAVIVDGQNSNSYALLEIVDVHHLAFEGITFRNHQQLDAVGILIEGEAHHIRINNCTIYDINFSSNPNAEVSEETNAQPIAIYGNKNQPITDIEISDSEIYNCRLGYSEALVINGNVDGFQIINNIIHDVTNIGIDIIGHEETCSDPSLDQARNGIIAENETYNCLSPYATSAGIYVDGGKDLIIERNRVYNNQWGIEIGCENLGKSTSDIIVRNNFIYRNTNSGIQIGGYDYPNGSGKCENISVLYNSFYGNETSETGSGEIYLSYNENLFFSQNIIYATNAEGYVLTTEDLSVNSTLVNLNNNNWRSSLGVTKEKFYFNGINYEGILTFEETGAINFSRNADPKFVALGDNPDLHLQENSLMIDAAIINGSIIGNLDFDGEIRTSGLFDIGADEYGALVSINNDEINTLRLYPNPAKNEIKISNVIGNRIELLNSNGQLIKLITVSNSELILDVSELNNGFYLIKNGYSIHKLIIFR